MADVAIQITGLEELDKYFVGLEDKIQKQALRKAVREVAKFTRVLALEYVPEDTGLLASSIKVRARKRTNRRSERHVVGIAVNVGEKLFTGQTFYGGFLEFGTKDRFHKTGKYVGKVARGSFDFLRRALYSFPERKREIYREILSDWIQQQRGAVNAGAVK